MSRGAPAPRSPPALRSALRSALSGVPCTPSYTWIASTLPSARRPIFSVRPTPTTSACGISRCISPISSSCMPTRIGPSPSHGVRPGRAASASGDAPNMAATACTGAPARCAGIRMFCLRAATRHRRPRQHAGSQPSRARCAALRWCEGLLQPLLGRPDDERVAGVLSDDRELLCKLAGLANREHVDIDALARVCSAAQRDGDAGKLG
eukprot:4357754-Prymnesium_polylepis.2